MNVRKEFEKETNKHCPEMSYNFLDYYHYEIAYSKWLEAKIRSLQASDNKDYVNCPGCGSRNIEYLGDGTYGCLSHE